MDIEPIEQECLANEPMNTISRCGCTPAILLLFVAALVGLHGF